MKLFYCGLFALVFILTAEIDGLSVCPSRRISVPPDDRSITSPGHLEGEAYGLGIDCTLTITTDPGKVFKVTLNVLDLKPDPDAGNTLTMKHKKCTRDNRLVINLGSKVYERCGNLYNDEPEEFTSTVNKLTVHLITEKEEVQNRKYFDGFSLDYLIEEMPVDGESVCPGRHIKKKRSGTLFSPGFPNNYGSNQNCRVVIPIPDNFQMNVWFSSFTLQDSPRCRSDWLTIRDEHGGHRMCAGGPNRVPPFQELKASLAKIHFKSDSFISKQGFRLHYNMTRLQQGHCMCTRGKSFIRMTNFNKKVRRLWHRIKFTIKTTQTNALIIFSKGKFRDYMYIGIRDGKLFYRSDLGTGSSSVIANDAIVNDNVWHEVEIRRRKRRLSITVDNGRAEDNSKTRGNFNKIDLHKSIGFILGTPPELNILPNFIGCIRDFTVDGREPLKNAYVSKPQYPSSGRKYMTKC